MQKHLLVVDLENEKILSRFKSEGQWHHKIVADEKQVFFFDHGTLHAFDVERKTVAFEITPPPGLLPYPVLTEDRLVFAMRSQPMCSLSTPEPRPPTPTPVVVFDRHTGAEVVAFKDGGIVLGGGGRLPYVQVGDVVVTVRNPVSAHRLVTE